MTEHDPSLALLVCPKCGSAFIAIPGVKLKAHSRRCKGTLRRVAHVKAKGAVVPPLEARTFKDELVDGLKQRALGLLVKVLK